MANTIQPINWEEYMEISHKNQIKKFTDIYGFINEFCQVKNIVKYRGEYLVRDGKVLRDIAELIREIPFGMLSKERNEFTKSLETYVPIVHPKLDMFTIYFSNGDFNINTGEFTEDESPEYNHRRIKARYAENESEYFEQKADLDRYFKDITLNEEAMKTKILEMIGVSYLPTKIGRSLFAMVGSGRNGKSTLMNMWRNTTYADVQVSAVAPQHIATSQFATLDLMGKVLNVIDDLDGTPTKQTGILKSLISGDSTRAEVKGGRTYTFSNEATIVISSNSVPVFAEKTGSNAMNDRVELLSFNYRMDKKDVDKVFAARLAESDKIADLLATWAALAAAEWMTNEREFTETKTSKSDETNFKQENNPVLQFINEEVPALLDNCTAEHGMTRLEMNDAYKEWHTNTIGGNPSIPKYLKRSILENGYKEVKRDVTTSATGSPLPQGQRRQIWFYQKGDK